jgi:hypothetical protein
MRLIALAVDQVETSVEDAAPTAADTDIEKETTADAD